MYHHKCSWGSASPAASMRIEFSEGLTVLSFSAEDRVVCAVTCVFVKMFNLRTQLLAFI